MQNYIWLAVLILSAVFEAVTVGLASIWFCAGALAALIASLLHGALWLQILLFVAVSALSMALLRPLAKKYFTPRHQATNADRVLGAEGVVLEPIDNLAGTGRVSVLGAEWAARSADGSPIPAEQIVTVQKIEGVKVIVTAGAPKSGKES